MQYREVIVARVAHHVGQREPVRHRVDELAVRDASRDLREPGRVPVGADFAARLVARAGAAVEPVERRRLQK